MEQNRGGQGAGGAFVGGCMDALGRMLAQVVALLLCAVVCFALFAWVATRPTGREQEAERHAAEDAAAAALLSSTRATPAAVTSR